MSLNRGLFKFCNFCKRKNSSYFLINYVTPLTSRCTCAQSIFVFCENIYAKELLLLEIFRSLLPTVSSKNHKLTSG